MGQAANKSRRNQAIDKASDLVLSGKARYDVKTLPDEVLSASLQKIKNSGTLMGMHPHYTRLWNEYKRRNP